MHASSSPLLLRGWLFLPACNSAARTHRTGSLPGLIRGRREAGGADGVVKKRKACHHPPGRRDGNGMAHATRLPGRQRAKLTCHAHQTQTDAHLGSGLAFEQAGTMGLIPPLQQPLVSGGRGRAWRSLGCFSSPIFNSKTNMKKKRQEPLKGK